MKVLYFSWLRERTGVGEEDIVPPPNVIDVESLIAWLKTRGGGYSRAFSDLKLIRVAVNQEYVGLDQPVAADDEVAFFPPMTGG
jgi:molybdopterin synthase sulfur carrier subunit